MEVAVAVIPYPPISYTKVKLAWGGTDPAAGVLHFYYGPAHMAFTVHLQDLIDEVDAYRAAVTPATPTNLTVS